MVIAGGGLAGLSLALQLRAELAEDLPETRIAVIEKTRRPLPDAAFKVGESMIELGSHYFGKVLDLAEYMDRRHLHKNGLRFHTGDTGGSLGQRPEIGPAEFPIVPSYQIDRGRFESDLRGLCEERNVTLLEGEVIEELRLNEAESREHVVTLRSGKTLQARWLCDASGRTRLLQKKLDLRRPSPVRSSSAFFRIPSRIKVGDLVGSEQSRWHQRDVADNRWLSTVHLCGRGYWVWLIPLSTGYTSVGIVADAEHHPFATFNKPERARSWLATHEPALAAAIEGLEFDDFLLRHDYSYLSAKAIDAEDRWTCVGEAAAFVDPLYSLGSDFIAMANSFSTRVISDELRGRPDVAAAKLLDEQFLRLAADAARTLSGNGEIFPHADVFGAKLWWDFFNYWSFMSPFFFQKIYRLDADSLARFRAMGERYWALNTIAQRVLESWGHLKPSGAENDNRRDFVPLPMYPSVLADQHLALEQELSPEETYAKMERDLETGRQLIAEVVVHTLRDLGPERAAEFGRLVGLESLDLPLTGRDVIDALDRRARYERLPAIARDLERALGRPKSETPLSALLAHAGGG